MKRSRSQRLFAVSSLSLAACALPLAWAHEAPQRGSAPPPSWEKLKAAYGYTVPAAFKVAEEARMPLESASPSNYVGHISPRPLLMINGKQDTTVPEAAARRLHDAAKEPKQVIWADAGHGLPGSSTLRGIEWLAEKLGKGR
jgi:fermentation-respiration switch protein FrsA (DUF1100 family)